MNPLSKLRSARGEIKEIQKQKWMFRALAEKSTTKSLNSRLKFMSLSGPLVQFPEVDLQLMLILLYL